jgi:hypothetical protein
MAGVFETKDKGHCWWLIAGSWWFAGDIDQTSFRGSSRNAT